MSDVSSESIVFGKEDVRRHQKQNHEDWIISEEPCYGAGSKPASISESEYLEPTAIRTDGLGISNELHACKRVGFTMLRTYAICNTR